MKFNTPLYKAGILAIIITLMFSTLCNGQNSIIPAPAEHKVSEGFFELSGGTDILILQNNSELKRLAGLLIERVKPSFDTKLRIIKSEKEKKGNLIIFHLTSENQKNKEGYILKITSDKILIESPTGKGMFYALQTLFRLLPNELRGGNRSDKKIVKINCQEITDYPRFSYRGMHLDVSRHFFPKEFVKKYIDLISTYKINTFHWHLTDDQGWRIEIKKYPELTSISAWRVDREHLPWTEWRKEPIKPGEKATYGGFYTQKEIKDIIQYARNRYVEIIPEIEMPGHSSEVFAAYPELSCRGDTLPVMPGSYWPGPDIFCAGNEKVFEFIDNVLTEVASLFPSKYIHIGGDEADKARWKECSKCQDRIKEEKLKNEEELQSYFIKRVDKILKAKGKKLIGWDEILEGGLAPDATVMSWRGIEGGIAAAKQGHDVIMTPVSHCYFDYYQADPKFEPRAIGGYTPLKKVYSFEPVPELLDEKQSKHILGAQANLWTEFVPNPKHAEYMVLPRMLALAEVVWSPKEKRNYTDFRKRVEREFDWFKYKGLNYSEGDFKLEFIPVIDINSAKAVVTIESEQSNPEIRYTLDGSEPDSNSEIYKAPVEIKGKTTLKAAIFRNGLPYRSNSEKTFNFNKATGKNLRYNTKYSSKYPGADKCLVNGLKGSETFSDGQWQGYNGNDMDVVIDLGVPEVFRNISVSFIQNYNSWILMPSEVEYYLSDDDENFKLLGSVKNDISLTKKEVTIKEFSLKLNETKGRYVRVKAINGNLLPEGHPGKGGRPFIFADEIIVE